jgi:hypothetical protein
VADAESARIACRAGVYQMMQLPVNRASAHMWPALGDMAEAFIGDGDGLTNLAADALASGTVPLARITGLTDAQISAAAAIDVTKLAAGSAGQFLTTSESDEPEWRDLALSDIPAGSARQVLRINESDEPEWGAVDPLSFIKTALPSSVARLTNRFG